MIDPEQFMNQPSAPMSTDYVMVPEKEMPMVLDADPEMLVPRKVEWNDKDTGEPRHFYQWELRCLVQDEAVKAEMELDRVTVRMRLNLDLTEDGQFESGKGKNVKLGRLREALGQQHDGWTPKELLGAGPFIGKVTHIPDKKNPERKYAEVTQVAKVS